MNKDNKILKVVVLILAIILVIIIILIFTQTRDTKALDEPMIDNNIIEEVEEPYDEIEYQNIIGNKHILNNNLDLQSIFIDSTHNDNYVIFNNNKIYYIYEPTKCYETRVNRLDLEERIKNCEIEQAQKCTSEWRDDCKKEYCTNYYTHLNDILGIEIAEKLPLCNEFDANDKLSLEDLSKKYIISQNIDGTNLQKIATYDLNSNINFNYLTTNNIYYNSDNTINTINIESNEVNKIVDNMTLVPRLFNQDILIFQNNLNEYKVYDNKNNILKENINILSDNNIVIDKYTNDLYSYDNLNIYKNGEVIYILNNNEIINEVFASYYNIYIVVNNNKLIKIKKKDYSFKEDIDINNIDTINKVNYLFIDSNSLIYLLINEKDVYTFDENSKEFNKIYSINTNYQIYHNYIITFDNNNLIIYNTITKNKMNINNILYYYLNEIENKLYIVINNENNIEISYYDIN